MGLSEFVALVLASPLVEILKVRVSNVACLMVNVTTHHITLLVCDVCECIDRRHGDCVTVCVCLVATEYHVDFGLTTEHRTGLSHFVLE